MEQHIKYTKKAIVLAYYELINAIGREIKRAKMKRAKQLVVAFLSMILIFTLVSCHKSDDVYKHTFYAVKDRSAKQTLIIRGAFKDRELLAKEANVLIFPEEMNDMTRLDFLDNSNLIFGLIWYPETHFFDFGDPAYYDLDTKSLHTCRLDNYVEEFQPLDANNNEIVVLLATSEKLIQYDIKNCFTIDVLLEFSPPEESLFGFSYEPKTNRLAYSLRTYSKSQDPVIIIRNLDNGREEIIDNGFRPSWSHNGEQLAYISNDGLSIWNQNNMETVANVNNLLFSLGPIPKWSNDDDFIVFNDWEDDIGVVKRYSLKTGTLDLLTQGSLYPVYLPNSCETIIKELENNH